MLGYLLILLGVGGIIVGLKYATRLDRDTDRRNAEKRLAEDALEEMAVADWKADRTTGRAERLLQDRTEEEK